MNHDQTKNKTGVVFNTPFLKRLTQTRSVKNIEESIKAYIKMHSDHKVVNQQIVEEGIFIVTIELFEHNIFEMLTPTIKNFLLEKSAQFAAKYNIEGMVEIVESASLKDFSGTDKEVHNPIASMVIAIMSVRGKESNSEKKRRYLSRFYITFFINKVCAFCKLHYKS